MPTNASGTDILNAIMDAAVDAIIVSNDFGTIVRANEAAHSLFGYAPGDLMGMNVRALMPTPMAGRHDAFMSNFVESGEEKIIGIGREVEGLHQDGHVFPLHLSVGEAKSSGHPIFVAILHDLTRRAASDQALARTMRLDAIGQMTGGISHDFNNLLTVVIGNLELAELNVEDQKTGRFLKNALEAAEMGAELTSRLMIFARKGSLSQQVTEMRRICQQTIDLLRRTLDKDYTIATELPEILSPVLIDPVQLGSTLVNLAVNARDAMPDGGKILFQIDEIEIDDAYMAQETDVEPGRYVRLLVSDDGEGMSPESQRRAFEPFYTTKADRNGTGLGLAMVYGFVRQSGGHITLYSEVGHGTSIGLYFPAIADAGGTKAQSHLSAQNPDAEMGNGDTILLVEDNPKVRQISTERLRALNYRVEAAENGDIAWQMLKENSEINLVFSDVVMPGSLTGYDLGARVRSEYPHIEVLLTSGYASDVVTGKMQSSEQFEMLHKPYHQRDLARRLAELLGRSPD